MLIASGPSKEICQAAEEFFGSYSAFSRGTRGRITPGESEEQKMIIVERAASNFVDSARNSLPKEYQQPAFQCFSYYQKCVDSSGIGTKFICAALLAICLAERIIPLAGGGSGGEA